MRDRFPLLFIAGLLLVGALGTFVLQGARRGSFADRLSTYRSEKDGARALYLLLEQGGVSVSRTQVSLDAIEGHRNLALVGVAFAGEDHAKRSRTGFDARLDGGVDEDELTEEERADLKERGFNALRAPPISDDESERLLEHVRNGATVLYVPSKATTNSFLTAFGVSLTHAEKPLDLRTLVPAQPGPWTRGVERVEARVTSFIDVPPRGVPLLVDDTLGLVAAAMVPYGQGRLVLIGAPELAMNQALARADNALLWLALGKELNRGAVLSFDEFHHGFAGERSMGAFAARYGMQYAFGQLLLGVMLWAASLKRFGRPRSPPEEARIGSTDALSATSRLYREGRHFGHAASSILSGLAAELAPTAGLSPRATPAELGAALELKGRKDLAAALLGVASQAARAQKDSDVLDVARGAALVRATLHHHRKKRNHR